MTRTAPAARSIAGKTILRYHGGKRYLSSWLASLAPEHTHRVYAFAGGLGERVNWPAIGVSEVANDVDGVLINLYRVMQDPKLFKAFMERVRSVPFSRLEWNEADITMSASYQAAVQEGWKPPKPSVDLAVAYFTWNRQSMAGRMDCWTPLTRSRTRGDQNAECNSWWNTIEGLPDLRRSLDRVVLECDDALRVCKREDDTKTLLYLDPTYLMGEKGQGRSTGDVYHFETGPEYHENLLKWLVQCRSKVMLSGYPSPLYDKYLKKWTRHEKLVDNKAQKGKTKRQMVECLWIKD